MDANIVMTGSGKYVEVQSSGEEATYSEEQLNALIALGKQGIEALTEIQKKPSHLHCSFSLKMHI